MHTCLRHGNDWPTTTNIIGLYRENAITIDSEARDPFGGNVYYVICIVTSYTLPPNGSLDSFWITRSQRSRRRDKGL